MARSRRREIGRRVRESPTRRYGEDPEAPAAEGVLLDTDVLIDVLRGEPRTTATLRDLEQRGVPLHYTAITVAEVYAGLRAFEAVAVEEFFATRREVVLDHVAGRRAGAYLARYATSHGVRIADALIAAAASTTGLTLWSANRKHFPMRDVRLLER